MSGVLRWSEEHLRLHQAKRAAECAKDDLADVSVSGTGKMSIPAASIVNSPKVQANVEQVRTLMQLARLVTDEYGVPILAQQQKPPSDNIAEVIEYGTPIPVLLKPPVFTHSGRMAAMSKYRNVKTDGYASKREADRAANLRLLELSGIISDLRAQVPFVLIPRQVDKNGTMVERQCSYVADFVYLRNGERVCEDTKGIRTADYIIKRKLMLFVHGISVTEV